ncbi:polyphosphate polymerase domain-containing protein [Desulforamulus aeronauticus]|uniref:VTC domain-containing protein n=1 Tax=Desulforamulus aeronauticus DSM 10349 TaxID=1121421 RepID=A0A1M6TNS5_9FIRM|nr:polyphosphate polymerase domain-containing protein [Desulforamulus aeronauticus]SHK58601.1 VTC domain-containing protein [Desulforamulus aeronauticus DSM 10349]
MVQFRHEIKMGISAFDRVMLSSRLSHGLKRDGHTGPNGSYVVRSIYFDDDNDTAVKEKLAGVKYREKFRIRTYDSFASVIKLEKKVKNNGVGYKESARLTREECQSLLRGNYDFLIERSEAVCKQLYIKMRTGLFKPKTIVQYNREAYVWNPGRVRITIDSNLKTGIASIDFLNFELPLTSAMDNGNSILEIKYDSFLPAHISNLIKLDSRQKGAFSKYVLCRRYR